MKNKKIIIIIIKVRRINLIKKTKEQEPNVNFIMAKTRRRW